MEGISLPPELYRPISEQIDSTDKQTLCALVLASRTWYQESIHWLYHTIQYIDLLDIVDPLLLFLQLIADSPRHARYVRSFSIRLRGSLSYHKASVPLARSLSNMSNLETLECLGSIRPQYAFALAKTWYFPSLRSFKWMLLESWRDVPIFVERHPHLRELTLRGWRYAQDRKLDKSLLPNLEVVKGGWGGIMAVLNEDRRSIWRVEINLLSTKMVEGGPYKTVKSLTVGGPVKICVLAMTFPLLEELEMRLIISERLEEDMQSLVKALRLKTISFGGWLDDDIEHPQADRERFVKNLFLISESLIKVEINQILQGECDVYHRNLLLEESG
ncbi:hypothetical protein BDN72DRAFT_843920 [Pluteus cervinus]|uniref:Uncharacterized protein n=1 Tax=Pluteus cervinus TaxID=181527 RepID=A0ACD3AMC9_9AGAR|nr:hypothetical protein BDN72DRAFT_843920 [Pluteus cervinus]